MVKRTPLMELIERRRGETLETALRSCIERGLNHSQIARELGITRLTLHAWLRELGAKVETRQSVRFPSDGAGVTP
jgi:transposase-like protein